MTAARRLAASGWTLPRVVAAAAALLVLATWVSSGSLVTALLVLVLVGGTAALAVVLFSWIARGPRPVGGDVPAEIPAALPTTDLAHVPAPAERVRRALRGLLARPWVRGDALVRAATARLASEDALVFTPRGRRVAAPHLWVEWNTADLAEVAGRWPLDVLARELADGYLEHADQTGVRRLADRTWVHLLAGPDVPVGRVVVTAAFSRPQRTPTASAWSPDHASTTTAATTTAVVPYRQGAPADAGRPPRRPLEAGARREPPRESGSAVWRRVLPALRTMRAPRPALGPASVGVLVAETPGAADVVLADGTVLVGRDPRADAVVDHPGVSWRHLTLARHDATTWLVTDAGSTNGTLVDDVAVRAATPVRAGDTVRLGDDGPCYRLALRTRRPDRRPASDRTRVEVT